MSWPDQPPLSSPPPPPPQSPYFPPPVMLPASPESASSQGIVVASFVLGIVAVVLVLPFFRPVLLLFGMGVAIAGVICGHIALSRQPANRGLAIAGLVLSYIGIALGVVHLLALFALGEAIRHRLR